MYCFTYHYLLIPFWYFSYLGLDISTSTVVQYISRNHSEIFLKNGKLNYISNSKNNAVLTTLNGKYIQHDVPIKISCYDRISLFGKHEFFNYEILHGFKSPATIEEDFWSRQEFTVSESDFKQPSKRQRMSESNEKQPSNFRPSSSSSNAGSYREKKRYLLTNEQQVEYFAWMDAFRRQYKIFWEELPEVYSIAFLF